MPSTEAALAKLADNRPDRHEVPQIGLQGGEPKNGGPRLDEFFEIVNGLGDRIRSRGLIQARFKSK
jgi:hypothetical protein